MNIDPNNFILFYLTGALLLVAAAIIGHMIVVDSRDRHKQHKKAS